MSPRGSLERERHRGIGGDLAGSHGRDDPVLRYGTERRMRAERDDRRRNHPLPRVGDRPDERVLDGTEAAERDGARAREAIRSVPREDTGGTRSRRSLRGDLQEQRGEVRRREFGRELRHDVRVTELPNDPIEPRARRGHLHVGGLPLRRIGREPSHVRSHPGPTGPARLGVSSFAARRAASHHDVRSSSNSSPTPCCIRSESCWCVSPSRGYDRPPVPNADRRPPLPRPRAPLRHRRVRAHDRDRHHRHLHVERQPRRPVAEPLEPPVGRTRPLGEHDDVPAVADQLLGLVRRLLPRAAFDREPRVDERRERRAPPHVEEVVLRRRGRGLLAPTSAGASSG